MRGLVLAVVLAVLVVACMAEEPSWWERFKRWRQDASDEEERFRRNRYRGVDVEQPTPRPVNREPSWWERLWKWNDDREEKERELRKGGMFSR